ncbi:SRPBCC family protein [Nonomuraea maritima]|uniref:SRPBCC family protein n=1 Tax=Nonomuraea maritima TaxID=683260 RepID=UPI00371387D1
MTEATKLLGKAAHQAQDTVSQGQEAVRESPAGKALPELPTGQLTSALQDLSMALAERALVSVTGKIEGLSGRLSDFADGGGGAKGLLSAVTGGDKSIGGSTIMGAAKGAAKGIFGKLFKGKGKGGGRKKLKLTNIVETVDIGAPRRIVYNQWTQFQDFPTFMKKVENVNQEADDTLSWKAQVFWSHRTWKSKILEQVPDERIIWRSEGQKGHVDGAVSFHALTPDITRVMVVLEYHPQGFFEHTGNLWRAQGRRARLELKHFARHVMRQVMLHPDDMEESGWRGEIRDGEVVKDHETAIAEEREAKEEEPEREEGAYEEEPEEGADRERAEAEEGEGEEQEEREGAEHEEREGEEPYYEQAAYEDYEEEPEEEAPPRRERPQEERDEYDEYEDEYEEPEAEHEEPEEEPAPRERERPGHEQARPRRRAPARR